MPPKARPATVWMPNVETFLLLVNLTEEGRKHQSRAPGEHRRAAWLKYDGKRRTPAVAETARLMADGFWLDSLAALALFAEPMPGTGFAYRPSREIVDRAGPRGEARLARYLECAAAFFLECEVADHLKEAGPAYRSAVRDLESSLGDAPWLEHVENYFGTPQRSYLAVASLLMPAGFTFGIPLGTPEGPVAVFLAGPFIEPPAALTFASPAQAAESAEREYIHALLRPVVGRGMNDARRFAEAFGRDRAAFARLGYAEPLECLRDQLANAVHARLLVRRGDRDAASALLAYDAGNGYAFTAPFARELEDYELHRTDFPVFESFFPRLMSRIR